MKDEGLEADATLKPAEAAVHYLLERIRCDANLRNLMIDTEAYVLCRRAEADRLGLSYKFVYETCLNLDPSADPQIPDVIRLRMKIQTFEDDREGSGFERIQKTEDKLEAARAEIAALTLRVASLEDSVFRECRRANHAAERLSI